MSKDFMCQANDVQGCEGSSPTALQTGDSGDAFLLLTHSYSLESIANELLSAYGDIPRSQFPGPPTSVVASLRRIALELRQQAQRQDEERQSRDERAQQAAPPA